MIHYEDCKVGGTTATRVITLNEAVKANALSLRGMEDLRAAISGAGDRAIVVTGAGKSFCGGLDLEEIAALSSVRAHLEAYVAIFEARAWCLAPVVSLVNGPAAAGGVGLAVCADICIAGASSTLTVPGDPEYGPQLRLLGAIVGAFRSGVSLDRLCGGRRSVAEAAELVDHVIAEDIALDRILERFVPDAVKRATSWTDAARAKISELVDAASTDSVVAGLLNALARR